MNRRTFLKTTAFASAALALNSCKTTSSSPDIPMLKNTAPQTPPELEAYYQGLIAEGLTPCLTVACAIGNEVKVDFIAGQDAPGAYTTKQITPTSRFNIGSVTKPITGTLMLCLLDQGKLTLDDPVSKHLPEYQNPTDTIRHLVTHSTGYAPANAPNWPTSPEDMDRYRKQAFEKRNKDYEPGTQTQYWSVGYFILLNLIEAVAQTDIESFARQRLFDPLGMDLTTFDHHKVPSSDAIAPWVDQEKRFQMEVTTLPPMGETGLRTTAMDLIRFGQLLWGNGTVNGHQILAPSTMELMFNDQSQHNLRRSANFWMKPLEGPSAPFGTNHSVETVGHPGYTGCQFAYDPKSTSSIAIVTNSLKVQSDFFNYTRITDQTLKFIKSVQ